jgi:Ca2+-binding RTX toxin-like protein
MPSTNQNSIKKSNNRIDIDGDFKNAKVDIIGSDIVITSANGTQKTFTGLGVQLFSNNPPQIFSNGTLLSPDDFLAKIGEIETVDVKEVKDVLTTLKNSQGQAETDKKVEAAEKVVIKEVVKEVVKVENVFTDTSSHNSENSDIVYGDTDTIQTNFAYTKQQQQDAAKANKNTSVIIEELTPPPVNFSTPPTPTTKPINEGLGNGIVSLTSNIQLLQTPYKLAFDSNTNILNVQGGGGSLSAAFNGNRATQVDPELIDLSEYVGKTEIYTDNSAFFNNNLITRVVSFDALVPKEYEASTLSISGLPSGFTFLGYTPNSNGNYKFENLDITNGKIKLLLQYDPNQFSNTATDIDGDGVAAEYSSFNLTFSYAASLKLELGGVTNSVNTDLTDETIIPVIVKQATSNDFLYHNNPNGWVIDIDTNSNVVLTGNSDSTVYGSPTRDNITSSLGNDIIYAGGGNDVIRTGVGNDIISGGTGSNSIDAGANVDLLTYVERTENITLNLSEGANQDGFHTATVGSGFVDIIRDVENLILGSGNDVIRGSIEDNIIEGRGGNDILDGGTAGNDTLLGGSDDDILRSGFGNDTLDGGAGTNTLEYTQSATGINTNQTILDVNGFYNVVNGIYTDKVKNISTFTGSNFNDIIIGNASNQTYNGQNGDDTIDGGEGLDTIDGGSGNDTVTYASLTSGFVSVSASTVTDRNGNIENLVNVENIHGTTGNDSFIGDAGNNSYFGLGGNDTFVATLGNDTINGGIGDDTLNTSALASAIILNPILLSITSAVNSLIATSFSGIETIIATSGSDLINYSGATNATTVNLFTNTAQQTGQALFNVIGFEDVTTGSGNDIITGDASNNILIAGSGNDTLYGSAGTDTINGDIGSDTFVINTTQGGTINLNTQTLSGFVGANIQNTTILSIENITQTGSGGVIITGSTSDNTLITDSGDDTFISSNGTDTIDGNAGSDTFDYSGFTTPTNLNLGTVNTNGFATLTSGTNTTLLKNIENIIATAQNDTVTGNNANNIITTGAGNDIIDGGMGLDTIDGGADTDTVTYQSLGAGVTVNGNTVIDAQGNSEALTNIEIIAGTNFDDTFISTAGTNRYQGLSGADTFVASQGTDTFEGGVGADTLQFNTVNTNTTLTFNLGLTGFRTATGTGVNTSFNGIETIVGSFQTDDTVTYGATSSAVTVNLQTGFATGLNGDANYTISGIENVTGGNGNDTIRGDANTNFLDGGTGSDILLSSTNQSGTVNLASSGNQISGFTGGDTEFTGDTVVNFENFVHTGTGNITVIGSTANNIMRTGSGNDTLNGSVGADALDGNFANSQNATDIVFDTFTGQTVATGWQLIQVSGITVPTVDTTNTTFTNFVGRVANGQTLRRDYAVTGTKDHAVLEFDLYEIDSFDSEEINFKINGTTVFYHFFNFDTNEFNKSGRVTVGGMTIDYMMTPSIEKANIGFSGWADQTHKVRLIITNPTSTISFTANAVVDGSISDESLGLDNVLFYSTNNLLGIDDGIDTLSYAGDSVGVTVNLNDNFTNATGTAMFAGLTLPSPNQTTSGATGSQAEGDTIRNFDNIIGGSGNDTITTKNYAINVIDAGAGDDRVIASIDTGDTLNGGTNGTTGDTLVVQNSGNTITNLALNTVTFAQYGDDLFGDTFSNFENYESTAFSHEKIIGSSVNNSLTTGSYDDYLIGGAGNDILNGGTNSINGGDWVGYENAAAVTANLATGTASSASEGTDTLINIENIRTAGGNDNITGSTANNTIDAGAGVDTVSGASGDDVLAGKAGNDTINGDNNNDKISGGTGADTLNGGNDQDIILGDNSYLNGLTHFYALNEGTGSTLTNLGTAGGTITQGFNYGTNTDTSLASGDAVKWQYGSPDGNNFANFANRDNNPRPKLPTITLNKEFTISSWFKFSNDDRPGNSNDFLFRLAQDDSNYLDVYRDAGTNNLRVRFQQNGVHLNQFISTITINDWTHFSYSMDELGYIRTYINGNFVNGYQFTGTVSASSTYTSSYIGLGWHSEEIQAWDGGISNFSIHNRTLSDTEVGGLYTDTKTGIDVTATTSANDIINGDAGNDKLSGGDGSDTINGGSGNDIIEEIGNRVNDNNNTLNGGDNDDTIYSVLATNTINGGNGTDSLRYDHFADFATIDLTINLQTGTATNGTNSDSFSNIELFYGGTGNDTFIGNSGNNTLYGNAGNDSFYGAAGNDSFFGGAGRDTIDFSSINVTSGVTANLGTGLSGTDITGIVSIDGNGGSDTLNSIENFTGSSFADTVTGSTADNTLNTGDGNDTINGSSGTDTIDGGTGTDTLNYTTFNQTTTITTTSVAGLLSGTDTYLNIENINTGAGNDTFTATASALLANSINYNLGSGQDTVSVTSGAMSGSISAIASRFDNIETLNLQAATGSATITGDDVVGLTDSNRVLRLNINTLFTETITSGTQYLLTNTTNNGTHVTYDFAFGTQTARLNIYEI